MILLFKAVIIIGQYRTLHWVSLSYPTLRAGWAEINVALLLSKARSFSERVIS